MPHPIPPPGLARSVSRHWAAFLAPPYLIGLLLLHRWHPNGLLTAAVSAGGPVALAYAGASYAVAAMGSGRVPGTGALLVWSGVVAMELHAAAPAVARTRTVPAVLCFALGYGLPPPAALVSILLTAGWLAAAPHRGVGGWPELLSILAMAIVSGVAGGAVRRSRQRRISDEVRSREAHARSRSLVLPWEEPRAGNAVAADDAAQDSILLRRERELHEGIRRTLEGLLPVTGAACAAFLSPSPTPGSARHDGFAVVAGADGPKELSVPDTYLPVREALLFGRPFLESGPEARRYAPPGLCRNGRASGVAAVPVFRGDHTEGALLVVRHEEGGWDAPVVQLLELGSYFIGRELERTRALHVGDRYLLREGWYHEMVRKMAQVGNPGGGDGEEGLRSRRERVYAEAVGQVRRQLGASRVLLAGTASAGKKGWITWEETESRAGGSADPAPMGDSYVGWVIRTGSQRIFSDTEGAARGQNVVPQAWARPGERSFLLFPVGEAGGFRGAIVCTHPEPGKFRKQHAEVVRDVMEVMQLGLSHVERLETLTRRATTDPLTGISNRKAFFDQLTAELTRLDGRHPCAVIMADIDHFKRVNDTYGHPFGDEVLRRVAGVLGKAVRKGDAVGRYGGEEFVLYLHLADGDRAREGAERFRQMIRKTKFVHAGREVSVTASFGVACAPRHGATAETLLKCADEALYLSKQRGRDQVTVFPG
jgi:diguanylate cyclase (GGDEF)-like protein